MEVIMKRCLLLCFVLLFFLSLLTGCGQKKETPQDTAPAGQPEEMMDSTRMDSASVDTIIPDSLKPGGEIPSGEAE